MPVEHFLDKKYLSRFIAEHSVADKTTGCRLWTGGLRGGQTDYPLLQIDKIGYLVIGLSMWIYGKTDKPLPRGRGWRKVHRHTCDNPRCVNGAHALFGSQKDNINDAVIRGRHSCMKLATKKFCIRGHRFDEKNTAYVEGTSGRMLRRCKACARIKANARYKAYRKRVGYKDRRKTHCLRGHPYDESNTLIINNRGMKVRLCKACNKIRSKFYRQGKGVEHPYGHD